MRHESQFSSSQPVYAFDNSHFIKDETLRFLQSIPAHLYGPGKWGRPGRCGCMMTHLAGWGGVTDPVAMAARRLNLDEKFTRLVMGIFDRSSQPQAKAVAIALIKAIPVNADTSLVPEHLTSVPSLKEYLHVMRTRPWEKGPLGRFLIEVLPARLSLALFA